MSDNEISADNVLEFPKTTAGIPSEPVGDEKTPAGPVVPPEVVAQKSTQSNEFVIKLIEKNRKKGIEQTQGKLERLTDRELHKDAQTESALRDMQGAVQGLLTWAEAVNSLTDYIKHDLVAMITNLQQQGAQAWQTAAHLQTLIETMKNKEQISEEELRATWDKLVVPPKGDTITPTDQKSAQ